MQDLITRTELLEALDKISDLARMRAHGTHDPFTSAVLAAKAEVCEELAHLLKPVTPSIAQQSRECAEAEAKASSVTPCGVRGHS